MENDEGLSDSVATASTDTSLFLRELQALDAQGGASGHLSVNQSALSGTGEVGNGEGIENPTLTQAMKTMMSVDRPCQIINLADTNDENGVGIYSRDVAVYAAPTANISEKSSGSNKKSLQIKITPVVNHMWEKKFYHGNLVAVHRDDEFVAYVLRGKSAGNVRVMSRKTANRVLLKNFSGNVMDIAFALSDDIYLASVDEAGTVFVHSLANQGDAILPTIVLHIEKEVFNIESSYRNLTRVIWCPYMPTPDDSNETMDPAKMLVLLHGTQAEVWNVDYVAKDLAIRELDNTVRSSVLDMGVMCIEPYEPLMPVVNAAFAPDGSAIAVAYQSGLVKFFQVDLEPEGELECMYDWNPHDGEPVTTLFFLDDHKRTVTTETQLWKFALTGAKHNTEIKIWSCESWACTQTIVLNPPLSQLDHRLHLTSQLDLSSHYFTLSDINSQVLYIFQIHQDLGHCAAHVTSLAHFPLAQTCLSCAIFDAGMKKFKHSANDSHMDEITTGELEGQLEKETDETGGGNRLSSGVQIKMYGVHTKSLQELLIRYRPETSVPPPGTPSVSSVSQEEGAIRDLLSDMSLDPSESGTDVTSHTDTTNQAIDPSILMTPMAFTSSASPRSQGSTKPEEDGLIPTRDQSVSESSASSFTQVTAMDNEFSSPTRTDNTSMINVLDTPTKDLPGDENLTIIDLTSHEELNPDRGEGVVEGLSEEDNTMGETQEQKAINGASPRQAGSKLLDELFTAPQSGLGHSIESASTTGSFIVKSPTRVSQGGYDDDDIEVAEALGQSGEIEDEEDEVSSREMPRHEQPSPPVAEQKQQMVWPDPPDVTSQARILVDQAIEQSTHEEGVDLEVVEALENAYENDEDEEAEVEEIIPHPNGEERGRRSSDDTPNYGGEQRHRTRSPKHEAIPPQLLTNLEVSLAAMAQRLEQQQEAMIAVQAQLQEQRELQLQLHRQQREQQQLQQLAVSAATSQQQQQPSLEKEVAQLEDLLVSRMEHSLAQHMQRETQRLQDTLKQSEDQRRQRDAAMVTNLTNDVTRQLKESVSSSLRSEIKQNVNPALQRSLDPLKERLHQEVAHRLTACDTLLKDNISKAVRSRSTMDVLATSIGDVIYEQLTQAYKDTFKTAFLPSFTASMEKTVQDVHGIFQQGTKEYQLYMRQIMDNMMRDREQNEELVRRLEAAQGSFVQSVGAIKGLVVSTIQEELATLVTGAVARVKDDILLDMRKIMKEEMSAGLREHGSAISNQLNSYLRSGAATPVPASLNNSEEESLKEKISRMVKSSRINEAYQQALSAGDLDLVIFVCETTMPMNIFSQTPCPLSQPVLLSLISQLSASMDTKFDFKMKFLEEAVLNLDLGEAVTAEHIPSVLTCLVQRLRGINVHNEPRKAKAIKMLIMAANSLLT